MAGTVARTHRLARWQALTVSLLVAGYAGYYLCRSNLSVAMPLIIAEMTRRGVSADAARIMLGSVASFGVLAYAIGKFPSGGLADYLGGRRNFLFGMAGSIVFTLLFTVSGGVPLFTLAWMSNRLAQSLGWAGMVKITSKWIPFRRYGTVMAIISLSFLFGDAVVRQFMALLIAEGLGWRSVFVVDAVVLAVLLGACLCLLRESPSEIGEAEPSSNPANLFGDEDASAKPRSPGALLRPLLRSRVFQVACALSLGTTILRETFNLWTPTYLTQAVGMTVANGASSSALFSFFGGASVILCGLLSDRLGRGGRAALLFYGLALSTVALLVPGLDLMHGSQWLPMVFIGVVGFLIIGPYSFLAGAIALDFGGKRGSGTASGIIDGVGYLGGVVSGDTVARVSVQFGWSGAFLALAAIAALSSLAAGVFLLHERRRA
ncbi:MAG: MFS transporter [Bryobacteraceae bacterium]|jgi:OPA family glycerol-3-phosphate transporter-like MFS transporter